MGGGISKEIHEMEIATREEQIEAFKQKHESLATSLSEKTKYADDLDRQEKELSAKLKDLQAAKGTAREEQDELARSLETMARIKNQAQEGVRAEQPQLCLAPTLFPPRVIGQIPCVRWPCMHIPLRCSFCADLCAPPAPVAVHTAYLPPSTRQATPDGVPRMEGEHIGREG